MKTFALNVNYLTIASSVVLPLLTGFVTKLNASSRVKAMTLLVLSIAGGLVQTLITKHGVVTWTSFVDNSITTFVLAAVAHQHALKPLGATAAVQGAAPDFGLGTNVAPVDTELASKLGDVIRSMQDSDLLDDVPSPAGVTAPDLLDLAQRIGLPS